MNQRKRNHPPPIPCQPYSKSFLSHLLLNRSDKTSGPQFGSQLRFIVRCCNCTSSCSRRRRRSSLLPPVHHRHQHQQPAHLVISVQLRRICASELPTPLLPILIHPTQPHYNRQTLPSLDYSVIFPIPTLIKPPTIPRHTRKQASSATETTLRIAIFISSMTSVLAQSEREAQRDAAQSVDPALR